MEYPAGSPLPPLPEIPLPKWLFVQSFIGGRSGIPDYEAENRALIELAEEL